MRRLLLVLAAVAAVQVPAGPALAHNQLVSAKPARDAVLREAPAAVTLAFLQRLNPDATTIVVSDAGKRPVPSSAPAVKAATAKVTLDRPLDNGAYTVAYRVVSVDGHTVQGSYTFTVADPSAPPAATPPASAAAAVPSEAAPSGEASTAGATVAAPAEPGGVPTGVLIGLGGLGGLLAAAAVYLYVSRRRGAAGARP